MIDQNIIQKAVDRVTAEVEVHRMYSPDMPEWLFNLPRGVESIKYVYKFNAFPLH